MQIFSHLCCLVSDQCYLTRIKEVVNYQLLEVCSVGKAPKLTCFEVCRAGEEGEFEQILAEH